MNDNLLVAAELSLLLVHPRFRRPSLPSTVIPKADTIGPRDLAAVLNKRLTLSTTLKCAAFPTKVGTFRDGCVREGDLENLLRYSRGGACVFRTKDVKYPGRR